MSELEVNTEPLPDSVGVDEIVEQARIGPLDFNEIYEIYRKRHQRENRTNINKVYSHQIRGSSGTTYANNHDECEVCGEDEMRITTHHDTPLRTATSEEDGEELNSDDNLVAVCPTCHSIIDPMYTNFNHTEDENWEEKRELALESENITMRNYRDKDWLEEKLVEEGWTHKDVADHCEVERSTVSTWAMKYDLTESDIEPTVEESVCKTCDQTFSYYPEKSNGKFCSTDCFESVFD